MGETIGRITNWVKAHPVWAGAIVLVVVVVAYLVYRSRAGASQAQTPQLAPADGTLGQPSTGGDVTVPPPSDGGGTGTGGGGSSGGGGIIQIQPYPISNGGSTEGGNAGPGAISGSEPGGAPGTLPGTPGSGVIQIMPYAILGETSKPIVQPAPLGATQIPGTGFGLINAEPPAAGSIIGGPPLGSASYGSNMPILGGATPIAPLQSPSAGGPQIQPYPAPSGPSVGGPQIQPYPAPGGGGAGGGRSAPQPTPQPFAQPPARRTPSPEPQGRRERRR